MSTRLVVLLTGAATSVVVAAVVGAAVAGRPSDVLIAAGTGFAVAVAWVIARRAPASPVGPALAWSTASIALVLLNELVFPGSPWSAGTWPVNLAGLLALLLVFPHGLRGGWPWRAVPFGFAAGTAGLVYCLWGAQEVAGEIVGGDRSPTRLVVGTASMVMVGLCLAVAASSVVIAYRHGDLRERAQIRWLMLAGLLVVILLVAGWAADAFGLPIAVAYGPFISAIVLLIPFAVGVAVIRHDLFDVDRLLSETASWLVTLGCSAAIFALVVSVVSQAVTREADVGPTAAAFVTALALLPLHQFVARVVGRFVNRDRHVALAMVERFAADVRAGRREPEEVEAVLREAQRDSDLRLLLAEADGGWVTLDGTYPIRTDDGFSVEAGGIVIARLILGHDSTRARRRLADLTRAAWVPIEVSRLRMALRTALAEARASHARLAEAAAAERRRLERDLHDGAQQRLLATGLRLRLLQRALPPAEASEVGAAVAELQGTVDELRLIANGVRPGRLDDGLAAALGAMRAATPLPFDLRVEDLPKVDDLRALTAYLVVAEAVANVLKHAQATKVRISVAGLGGRLALRISDDGIGGVSTSSLGALRDRVLNVGGTLEVSSPTGKGTTVEAVI